jgi:hypothetical protein
MTTDCEHIATCPIHARYEPQGTQNYWIRLFCKGPKQEECAAIPLLEAGEQVPDTLMPNGRHFDPLDTFIVPRLKE